MRHSLLWLAIVLAIVWLVLRFALAVTGAMLHLLWIAAIVMLIIWAFNHLRGGGNRPAV